MQGSSKEPMGYDAQPPFSQEIQDEPVPSRFKMPQVDPYDGTTDPLDHLESYKALMRVQGATDALMCIAFPATLRRAARVWFARLEPRSIDSFQQLERRFMAHFDACRKVPREADSLFSIRQGDGELLRDYVTRFKTAALEVYSLDEPVAMLALKRGLKTSRLTYSLDKKPPATYSELLTRVHKYIRAEEADRTRRELDGRPSKRPSNAEAPAARRSGPPDSRPAQKPKGGPFPERVYTPLTQPRAKILMEIEGERYLRRPRPQNPAYVRDKTKYCQFHRDYGHDTEECRNLKREIEDLIKRGYLRKFVQGGAPPEERPIAALPPPPAIENQPTEKPVGMISWGVEKGLKRPRGEGESSDGVLPFVKGNWEGENVNNDAVVVEMTIARHPVHRIMVDSGSSTDVLFYDAFSRMKLSNYQLKPVHVPLVGFTGDSVGVEGEITLPVTAGNPPRQSTIMVTFTVVRLPSPYNAILGRPGLNQLDAVISTRRLLVQFPTPYGVGEMRGAVQPVPHCFSTVTGMRGPGIESEVGELDQRDQDLKGGPGEQLIAYPLGSDPAKTVQIGAKLPEDETSRLLSFLRANTDVFAWTASDMPGIPPDVITHQLNIDPKCRPVRQKKRSFAPERQKAIQDEVEKLLSAGFVREVQYPDWLANVVMVKKSNGKWRICVDYTDLNRACPKDSFPLPKIDQLVDATSGHRLLSFLDAFSGYHQIRMHPEDEEHTAFITDQGTFCYKMMPFGLKNAGATYQRLVSKVFKDQIGRNVQAYVDDMLVMSKPSSDHVEDLKETFSNLRRHQMKLNPAKCAFGVGAGKFLGFMVTQRGIEANPEKVQAILDMEQPTSKKQVQRLTGRVAALSRFISRSADRCQPFFKVLRKMHDFNWTEECKEAFEELKKALTSPPLLSRPEEGEELLLYLAVTPEAVSSVLVRTDDGGVQRPVYYTSKLLREAETRYTRSEKLVYALIVSAQRLRPYFQAHRIVVMTDQPLKAALSRPDTSGRLAKWALKLSEFDVAYRPRTSMKAQVLADFVVECTGLSESAGEHPRGPPSESSPEEDVWVLHVDGASNSGGSGAGLILANREGIVAECALRFQFPATNNQAEYEALIAGLKVSRELGISSLKVFTDSQLVAGQISGEFEARDPQMQKYLELVRTSTAGFRRFDVFHIPRGENARADTLSRLATVPDHALGRAHVEHLQAPSYETLRELQQVDHEPSWMDKYIRYITDGSLPEDRVAAGLIKRKAARFVLMDGLLYRRSFSYPLLKCLRPAEAAMVLQEIHEGVCGNHVGGRTLAYKAIRQGYFWETMREDAAEYVKKCDRCQRHATIQRQPAAPLSQLSAPWPFAQWGMDILGPFPPASGQRKFLVVAIDYFTKWVEAEPLARITEANVQRFFWKSIICRFGLPRTIITDNGRQFDNRGFEEFCADLGIIHRFTSVAHPQTNGEAEVTNRTILQGLRTRLDQAKGRWAEELPSVLWAYHTTPRVPTDETPFNLVFGTEAVVPVELSMPTLRVEQYDETENPARLLLNLDLLEETRDKARVRMAAYRQRVARYYNSKVKPKAFCPGDLVLRRAEASQPRECGKLSPNWEGPYRVVEALPGGAYYLAELDGRRFTRTWNAANLRAYHQ